ncbi:MAG: NADH-quinone oxidoreductase subunit H [Candidatus Thermoplasmatota archaeon]|nr:NADH-quinone oxidoreductase subunit H [Candidatus Thermoplasmatota archaeon]
MGIDLLLLIKILVLPVILGLFAIFVGLLYKGIDRKIAAHMQARIGPPIRQPFRDVRKLLIKENIIPENAIEWVFNLAPVVAVVAGISILLYVPIGTPELTVLSGYGDLILIIYLLMIPALALVIGGMASGSPYATVGAQREMVMMMSYEFPLAVAIVAVAWKLGSFSLPVISSRPVWGFVEPNLHPLGFVGFCLLVLTLLVITPIELSKIPFDVPEAETEIGSGLLAEYSGRNLALFVLADGVKTVAIGSLVVATFFPWGLAPLLGLSGWLARVVDILFFLLKVLIIIIISVTFVRVAAARLKIDQVAYTYFIPLTVLAFCGLALVVLDELLFMGV